jgi:hypothetical protein
MVGDIDAGGTGQSNFESRAEVFVLIGEDVPEVEYG